MSGLDDRQNGFGSGRFVSVLGFHGHFCSRFNRFLKNSVRPSTELRTNDAKFGIADIFPFMLSVSKHFEGVFQQPVKVQNRPAKTFDSFRIVEL